MTGAQEQRWYRCPVTGAKLLRLTPQSAMAHTPVYCRRCRREHMPLIREGRLIVPDSTVG